ncbi:FapA family protein [Bacillus mexicanus]|uniref:FapA family protein n=1 Tax=Bacillus mexicanus TaxID=2834415 RepID=UPI003D1F13BD
MKWFSKSETDKFSKVKFLHNKFYFEDPDKPAKITIQENDYASVLVNESPVKNEVEFSSTDKISISYRDNIVVEPSFKFEVFTDENNEEALLQKTITLGKGYQFNPISEFEHNPKLFIKELNLHPSPIAFDEVESFLKKQGFNGVFNNDNIHQICVSEENITLPVVTSRESIPGKPARFELLNLVENGKQIKENQFFAEYVDETPGEPGFDIYGIKIEPEDLTFFPDIGENVLVEDRGLMSLKNGRLVYTPYSINIIEEQNVEKTLTYEDGLVEYDGDVVINGDIKEGGQIKCTGNLTVLGGVFESYVFADGNIVIKGNADQSVIYSGFSKTSAKQVETYSLQYLEVLERVMFESSFTAEDGFDYEEKTKSLELAKSEFNSIQQSIDPFLSLIQQFGSPEIQQLFDKFMDICKQGTKTVLNDQSNTEDIRLEMEKFYAIIEESKEHLKDDLGLLETGSANSSHLFGYNKIKINGTGTFQTIIESNESVEISGKSLSTQIVAEQYIEVGEFKPGTQQDMKLYVKKSSGYVKIDALGSDSLIQIGDKKYAAIDDEKNVVYETKNIPKN